MLSSLGRRFVFKNVFDGAAPIPIHLTLPEFSAPNILPTISSWETSDSLVLQWVYVTQFPMIISISIARIKYNRCKILSNNNEIDIQIMHQFHTYPYSLSLSIHKWSVVSLMSLNKHFSATRNFTSFQKLRKKCIIDTMQKLV